MTTTRRDFLRRSLGGLTAAGSFGSVTAHAETGTGSESRAFDLAVAGDPRLVPFKGVDPNAPDPLRCDAAVLSGRWPAALAGCFYRNGPAVFERDGRRYHHWFAGDGMVQQFTLTGGAAPCVSHLGRLVRTPKFEAEQAAGRFLWPAYGTRIEGDRSSGGPDTFNVANTNALEFGGRVLALWEGGSAFAMSPTDLRTEGAVTWGPGLEQMPFSAHPKIDAAGHLWNFGTSGEHLVVWHVDPAGRLVAAKTGVSPYPGGMAHDAAVTDRWLVLPLPPVKLRFGEDAADGSAFVVEPDQPLRILVCAKDDPAERRVFELPPQMVFHVGNAHETADGQIVLSVVATRTPSFVVRGASDLLAGRLPAAGDPPRTVVVRLDLRSGRATQEAYDDHVEFPRVHPRLNGRPSRLLACAANWRLDATPGLFHGVQLRDLSTGRVDRHDYGSGAVAEEHVLVPKPGARDERDAWLLGTTRDLRRGVTRLHLLDARHVGDGPVAEATLPYGLPYGFHGNFSAA